MNDILNRLIFSPTPPDTSTSFFCWKTPSLLPLLASHLDPLWPHHFQKVTAQVVKVWLSFGLHEGNKFPGVWECIMSDPLVGAILVVEGPWPLPIFPAFVWPGAGQSSWLDAHHHFMSQHLPVFGNRTIIEVIMFHLFPCALAGSFLCTLTGISGPAAKDIPQTQLCSHSIYAWECTVLCWECQTSLQHHSADLISAECHSRWHLHLNSQLDHPGFPTTSERHKVTNADHPNQIDEKWLCPIVMSSRLPHPWISHPKRLASWPSLGDLSLHTLICGYCWMLSSLSGAENFDHLLSQNFHPQKRVSFWRGI